MGKGKWGRGERVKGKMASAEATRLVPFTCYPFNLFTLHLTYAFLFDLDREDEE
jgi:hypothetical protein